MLYPILSIAVAPLLFWAVYLYYQDRLNPEPFRNLGIAYLLGFAAAGGCLLAYEIPGLLGIPSDIAGREGSELFCYSMLVIGPVEELAKFLPFILVCTRFRSFDEPMDGIVYAAAISLGFASYENIGLLDYLQGAELYAGAIALPLLHTLFASVWGFAYAHARFAGASTRRATVIALAVSAAVHGFYDFLALNPELASYASLTAIALFGWRIHVVRRLHIDLEAVRGRLAQRPRGATELS